MRKSEKRETEEGFDRTGMREVVWVPDPPPGFDLVRRLNEQPNSEPTRRLSALILKVKRLQDLERTHKKTLWFSLDKGLISSKRKANADRRGTRLDSYEHDWSEQDLKRFESDPVTSEVCRLNLEIKKELNQFSFLPRLHVSAFGTSVGWIPPTAHLGSSDYNMVASVLSLAERDDLGRIGKCDNCGQWFCSRRPGYQKFCGGECQQAQYKSSAQWRAHRARYMRHYRRVSGRGGV